MMHTYQLLIRPVYPIVILPVFNSVLLKLLDKPKAYVFLKRFISYCSFIFLFSIFQLVDG